MFTSFILNIAITLVFVYMVLAVMITGINEFLFTLRRTRARCLNRGITWLFFDAEWAEVVAKIKDSPFLSSLKKKKGIFPAAIPAENFTGALLTAVSNGKLTLGAMREAVEKKTEKGELFTLLSALLSREGITWDDLQKEIEKLYDNAMERVTGWYRKYAKILSFALAFLIAAALNIDTIDITLNLWKNKEQAEKLAAFAINASGQFEKNQQGEVVLTDAVGDSSRVLATMDVKVVPDTVAADTLMMLRSDAAEGDPGFGQARGKVVRSYNIMVDLGIPMGWTGKNIPQPGSTTPLYILWLVKLIGILLTAFATSQGAPFWYDLLKKITPLKKSETK